MTLEAVMTLERAPIFLNCLSRGGSNIFWNLFLSHPDACSPIEETLQIFRADTRAPRWAGIWTAVLSRQPRFFDQWNLSSRRPLGKSAARFVDRTLRQRKLRTLTDPEMRFKTNGEPYTEAEVEAARLVAKNNNGLVFLTESLLALYPDATFCALVRHPLPLYESHKRHRIHSSPEAFADFYNRVTGKMADDAERYERASVTRFEDVLAEPIGVMRRLHEAAGLDVGKIHEVRFKSKEHYLADGSRGTEYAKGRHHWFGLDEVGRFLEPAINDLQADQLGDAERDAVLLGTTAARERLGYEG